MEFKEYLHPISLWFHTPIISWLIGKKYCNDYFQYFYTDELYLTPLVIVCGILHVYRLGKKHYGKF